MDWLTHLYLFGRVKLVADMRNARPAFTRPEEDSDGEQ